MQSGKAVLETIGSLATQLSNLLPTLTPSPAPKRKLKRDTTTYKENKTASLALPETAYEEEKIKKEKKAPPLANEPPATVMNTLVSLSNTVISLFYPTKPIETKKIEVKTTRIERKEFEVKEPIFKLGYKVSAIKLKMKEIKHKLKKSKDSSLQKTLTQCEEEIDQLYLAEAIIVKNLIKEHAARRVDLFFYLLVAVYKTGATITKSSTEKQHGKGGDEYCTQGCHSSLFPSVNLDYPFSILSSLSSIVWSVPDLSKTFLIDSLNATVELPTIINAFDGHLEGRGRQTIYRKKWLEILNRTALGVIDPKQAMTEFLQSLNQFFTDFEKRLKRNDKKLTYPKAKAEIFLHQKAGTFLAANEDFTVNDAYLYLMLRMPIEKQRPDWLPNYYLDMQKEIYAPIASVNIKDERQQFPLS